MSEQRDIRLAALMDALEEATLAGVALADDLKDAPTSAAAPYLQTLASIDRASASARAIAQALADEGAPTGSAE